MKVYIAGVINKSCTLSEAEIAANIAKFAEAEATLRALGYDPFNPTWSMPEGSADSETWHRYMRIDFKALVDCDAIYLIPGWEDSPGARLKVELARRLAFVELGPDQLTKDKLVG